MTDFVATLLEPERPRRRWHHEPHRRVPVVWPCLIVDVQLVHVVLRLAQPDNHVAPDQATVLFFLLHAPERLNRHLRGFAWLRPKTSKKSRTNHVFRTHWRSHVLLFIFYLQSEHWNSFETVFRNLHAWSNHRKGNQAHWSRIWDCCTGERTRYANVWTSRLEMHNHVNYMMWSDLKSALKIKQVRRTVPKNEKTGMGSRRTCSSRTSNSWTCIHKKD